MNDRRPTTDTTEVADLLKGPRGTGAGKIGRLDQPIVYNIIRDEIPRFSVPDAYM